ncbi:hypothetical protein [Bacillus methanolicus]|nr:hypothetical protein [Bacillus methanolicus]
MKKIVEKEWLHERLHNSNIRIATNENVERIFTVSRRIPQMV